MSNNHSLGRSNPVWPLAVLSNVLIVLGLVLIANWIGGSLMYLYLGRVPVAADFAATGPEAAEIKNMILTGQIGGTLVGLVILPLLYLRFLRKDLAAVVFNPSYIQFPSFLLAALSITFCILPLVGVIGDWNKELTLPDSWQAVEASFRAMENKAAQVTRLIVRYDSAGEMVMILFTMAFLATVAEELVFRGILLNDLMRSTGGNVHLSVFLSAAVFSCIHFQFFGFFPRMLLGIVLGYLYLTSGNLIVAMLMHFINNAMVVIALNLHAKGVINVDPESSKDLPSVSIYLSIVLSSAIMYFCWKMYKERTNTTQANV